MDVSSDPAVPAGPTVLFPMEEVISVAATALGVVDAADWTTDFAAFSAAFITGTLTLIFNFLRERQGGVWVYRLGFYKKIKTMMTSLLIQRNGR
mmetsp:Transcript_13751/g.18420  ORF Transcript_13751/g.18420 Transcript_13751/m.18420 type:complete len:94 (+) Transcript_13751:949-1230(+)